VIKNTIVKANMRPVDIDIKVSIGVKVPKKIKLHRLPPKVVEILPPIASDLPRAAPGCPGVHKCPRMIFVSKGSRDEGRSMPAIDDASGEWSLVCGSILFRAL
jgi:hypothetical protein